MRQPASPILILFSLVVLAGCGAPEGAPGEPALPEEALGSVEQRTDAYDGYRSQEISILESDKDVDSGIHLPSGYKLVISCDGLIWAGVWLTGENGPAGWLGYEAGNNYPLPGVPPYSVLVKLNGKYQYVGSGKSIEFHDTKTPIIFRINDDAPGNGNGSFQCFFETYQL